MHPRVEGKSRARLDLDALLARAERAKAALEAASTSRRDKSEMGSVVFLLRRRGTSLKKRVDLKGKPRRSIFIFGGLLYFERSPIARGWF